METKKEPNLNIKPPEFYSQYEGVSRKTVDRWRAFEDDKKKNGVYNNDLHPDIVAVRQGLSSFIVIFGGMFCFILMCVIPFLPIEFMYLEIFPIIVFIVIFCNKKNITEELNK